jgi:hypothetical protein
LWRSKLTPLQTWLRRWKQVSWLQHLSGRILKPFQVYSFGEKWTSLWPVIHASPSALQDSAKELKTQDTYGLTSHGQLTMFDQVLFTWKTWKGTLASDSGKLLPIWLRSDTEWQTTVGNQRSEYSQRVKQAQAIRGNESSSSRWMTPHGMTGQDKNGKEGSGGEFAKQVTNWQTPATDSFRSRGGDRKNEMGLDQQSRSWPTPRTITGGAESAERKKELGRDSAGGGDLQAAVQNWPTVTVQDAEQAGSNNANHVTLNNVATRTWHTPTVQDMKTDQFSANRYGTPEQTTFDQRLRAQVQNLEIPYLGPMTQDGQKSLNDTPTSPRRLNPVFVEALQDWPLFWTDIEWTGSDLVETECIEQQLQKPSAL